MNKYFKIINGIALLGCGILGTMLAGCNKSLYNAEYQDPTLLTIAVVGAAGPDSLVNAGAQVQYGTYTLQSTTQYTWSLPADAQIINGAGSNVITVQFGIASGQVGVAAGDVTGSVGAKINFSISGDTTAAVGDEKVYISTSSLISGVTYAWTVPASAVIESGQGTNSIKIKFNTAGQQAVTVDASDAAASLSYTLPVTVQ
jgi:hypothetical protein